MTLYHQLNAAAPEGLFVLQLAAAVGGLEDDGRLSGPLQRTNVFFGYRRRWLLNGASLAA